MALTQSFDAPKLYFAARTRWRPVEIAFWLATLLPFALFPDYLILASQIAITALFALSLDLILGYAAASSRSAMPRSSASAPMRRVCFLQIRLGRADHRAGRRRDRRRHRRLAGAPRALPSSAGSAIWR